MAGGYSRLSANASTPWGGRARTVRRTSESNLLAPIPRILSVLSVGQRSLMSGGRGLSSQLGLILAYGFPVAIGIRGIVSLLFTGLLCYFPALVLSMILVFKIMPPKYLSKTETVTTLFRK